MFLKGRSCNISGARRKCSRQDNGERLRKGNIPVDGSIGEGVLENSSGELANQEDTDMVVLLSRDLAFNQESFPCKDGQNRMDTGLRR